MINNQSVIMSRSIHNTHPNFESKKMPRFRRLDMDHISAIESLYKQYPFLNDRMEIHMPFHRAKSTFSNGTVWVWPKFDRHPVGYLIFMDGFAPCIWYPDRQEGITFRWILPPSFSQHGPTICLANILAGESVLQIEDIIIYKGMDLWSHQIFSERWNSLREFWSSLPPDQPLLAFKPQIVKPIPLEEWEQNYNPAIYWIIQPDHHKQPRWYWKDVVTTPSHPQKEYIAPKLKRGVDVPTTLCAFCSPYTKLSLPDTYSLTAQGGESIGIASISTMGLSLELRKLFSEKIDGIPVEVKWNSNFKKYQIMRIMPADSIISASSFFNDIHL
jgi:hypothetical protein